MTRMLRTLLPAAGMALARGATGAVLRRACGSTDDPVRERLAWLVAWQAGLFTAVEVVERLGAHRSPVELLHGPLFPTGLVLQVLVAVVLLGALGLFERVGAAAAFAASGLAAGRRRTSRASMASTRRSAIPFRFRQ